MTIEEAVIEFGSGRQVCIKLGISDRNFTSWNKKGFIPEIQQLRIEKITKGRLKADDFGVSKKPIKPE